jgi:hypothetical protein
MTECKQEAFAFTAHFSHRVEAGFTGGQVCSDGGSLLLREADRKINLLGRLAACFSDGRSPLLVRHQLSEMLAQRIYGLALGYEDLNDHEQLRRDPLLAVLAGKRNLDEELAGKSTLNRLELAGKTARYHKIGYSAEAIDQLLADLFIESHATQPRRSCSTWTPPTSRQAEPWTEAAPQAPNRRCPDRNRNRRPTLSPKKHRQRLIHHSKTSRNHCL